MRIESFKDLPIIGILRGIEKKDVAPLSEAVIDSGLKSIEVTMNTDQAADIIRELVQVADQKLFIGAGTVITMQDLESALAAGASYIVSPVVIPEVVSFCVNNSIPVFPGALTPQEIYNAWEAGATMVKVFPSGSFGPEYFKSIKGPFNDVELMACGGVSTSTIKDYFAHGADAVAFGASIFRKDWLDDRQYQKISEAICQLIKGYRDFKKSFR